MAIAPREKAKDCEHSAGGSPESQTIKVCDMISNIPSVISNDPKFARIYVPEKERLLHALLEADLRVSIVAQKIISKYKAGE